MTTTHSGAAGATRTCPHCRETILESASVCPACRHKLRFSESGDATTVSSVPLRVEGSLRNPDSGAWEYSMLLTIRNERGEEVARKLVGVGALQPGEQRSFTLSVEMQAAAAGGKRTRPY